jgi:predicted transcriptional regulator
MTKEEFNSKLKELNLSIKDFSQIADIPYSTINNWGFTKDDKTIPVPKWVVPFLEHYEKSKKYDYLMGEVFKVAKSLEKSKKI